MPYTKGVPYVAGSDTSEAAAASMEPTAGTLRFEVLAAIRAARARGRTCDEVEVELQLRHQTASARVRELAQRGLVFDSNARRPTRSGRAAVVWVTDRDWVIPEGWDR